MISSTSKKTFINNHHNIRMIVMTAVYIIDIIINTTTIVQPRSLPLPSQVSHYRDLASGRERQGRRGDCVLYPCIDIPRRFGVVFDVRVLEQNLSLRKLLPEIATTIHYLPLKSCCEITPSCT